MKELKDCSKEELMKRIYHYRYVVSHYQTVVLRMRADMMVIKKQLNRVSENIIVTKTRGNLVYHTGGKQSRGRK